MQLDKHNRLYSEDEAASDRLALEAVIGEFQDIERKSAQAVQDILKHQFSLWAEYGQAAPPLLVSSVKAALVDLVKKADASARMHRGENELGLVDSEHPAAAATPRRGLFGWLGRLLTGSA